MINFYMYHFMRLFYWMVAKRKFWICIEVGNVLNNNHAKRLFLWVIFFFSSSDDTPFFINGILVFLIPPTLLVGLFTLFYFLGTDFPIEFMSVNEFDLIISLILFYGVTFCSVNECKKRTWIRWYKNNLYKVLFDRENEKKEFIRC